ncbi:YIP1 family protein [Chryseobacterium sp. MYb264]|uniref:YIP1 family protein n=1 Tax=Chryseobacterium sp. MYb264 TaxID=2745153 RepID=UPI002E12D8E1|nr:YIP1 family protein [Chryseobacterium sp. MYb264]
MVWKTIFNPFLRYNERQLLIIGLISLIVTVALCQFFGMYMDAIFHYSYLKENDSALLGIGKSIISYSAGMIVLLILGKIYNKKTRIVDIINTVIISQTPGIITILLSELPIVKTSVNTIREIVDKDPQNLPAFPLAIMCIFSFVVLLLIAYGITLIYNGFRTSTNMKNWKQIVIFAFVVLTLCIISQLTN